MQLFYKIITTFVLLSISIDARSKAPVVEIINEGWEFHKGSISFLDVPDTGWEQVALPHTYNSDDVMDDEPGYYRGEAWYRKKIVLPQQWENREVYIHFNGVNQEAHVYMNQEEVGIHRGGYTAFTVRVDKQYKWNKGQNNYLYVKVMNTEDSNIPPLSADFTFFGGIYRDVLLEAVEKIHFDRSNFSSSGIFVTTPIVSEKKATVRVKGTMMNHDRKAQKMVVQILLQNPNGNTVAIRQQKIQLQPMGRRSFDLILPEIINPSLWHPSKPNLYKIVCQLINDSNGDLVDIISQPVGFRWFHFDAEQGFFLNGKPFKLQGVSRHQDYPGMGNAVPAYLQQQDIRLIKEMGANFIRIAHYPHDQSVLDMCDRLGILTSVEIPVVNAITPTTTFTQQCLTMQQEMIRQYYNHPSIIIWGYMNEILLRPKFAEDTSQQKQYFLEVEKLAKKLDSLTRSEDSTRYTMMAFHGNYALYDRVGLIRIPQIVGWNLYMGWYSENMEALGPFLDNYHSQYPNKYTMITEYGADGDPRIHSFQPKRFDKSVEYEVLFHKHYLHEINARPYIAGSVVWNFSDFISEERQETMPHVNNKGLTTLHRIPKDAYYFYQSKWSGTPVINIGSRNWNYRSGIADTMHGAASSQPIEVYTNVKKTITVYNNGVKIQDLVADSGYAVINMPLYNGKNRLLAIAKDGNGLYTDQADIFFQIQPAVLQDTAIPFFNMNINVGDSRFYMNEQAQEQWLPDQPYKKGSWGFADGTTFQYGQNGFPASNRAIRNTSDDPVYQTQLSGIKTYKMDVPDGKYSIELLFCELEKMDKDYNLVYNLKEGSGSQTNTANRDFDIVINGVTVAKNVGNIIPLPPFEAVNMYYTVQAYNGEGITLTFKPHQGKPILNGIKLNKIL